MFRDIAFVIMFAVTNWMTLYWALFALAGAAWEIRFSPKA